MTDIVSLNPVNVQRNTIVEYLWKKNQYRPPWLWSVIDILKKSVEKAEGFLLKCDLVGGGSRRGAHNCGSCDKQIINKINDFSLEQNPKVFNNLSCDCMEKWYDQINLENMGFGSLTDISRMKNL